MADERLIASDLAAKAAGHGQPTRTDILVALIVVLIAGFFFVRWIVRLTHRDDMYFLAIANAGTSSVEITENVTGQRFTAAAGEDTSFNVMTQPKDKASVEREFTVTVDGATKILRSPVVPTGTIVIDATAASCFVLADYARRFHAEGQGAPNGTPSSELDVLEQFGPRELFTLEPGRLQVPFGMPVPEITYNKQSERFELVRLVRTPCALNARQNGLYEYLMSH